MYHTSFKNKKKSKSANSNAGRPSGGNRNRGGRPQSRGGRKPSTLNPSLLVKKASNVEIQDYQSDRFIADLPINEKLRACLQVKGFERPTEIQDKTLETLLEGRDLLGIAQTGTGKTGAFLIPIIDELMRSPQKPYALIMVPTRELATQVEDEFKSMAKGLGLYSSCHIGGTNINRDLDNLRRKAHLVIGTPGRLLDLANRKALNLNAFNTLVLDEFDRMLDMGFVHDVKKLISGMHQRQHTLLFSATLDKTQESLIAGILTNHATVKVSQGQSTGDHIDQDIVRIASGENKFDVLCGIIANEEYQKVLVFEETKHQVKKLCIQLNKAGFESDDIHGNKSQNARQTALNAFKQGRIRVLVATDVAARGIDVSNVTHVINYQVPQTFDSYIHRIGRTGRAGKAGKALTFVS
jgi:ATP-dependent RNA helicase RhlE